MRGGISMMKKATIIFLALLVLGLCPARASAGDGEGTLLRPLRINLYYDNRETPGYLLRAEKQLYLLVDSAQQLFQFNDSLEPQTGRYLVNGSPVGKYYFGDNLYLNMLDLSDALGLAPTMLKDGTGVIFLRKEGPQAGPSAPEKPTVAMEIKDRVTGKTTDPVNNNSHVYVVGLTNRSSSPLPLNHFNFALLSRKGFNYVSVRNIQYVVVAGDNDTADTLVLDPGHEHVVTLTFELPDDDVPGMLIVRRNKEILGSVTVPK